MTYQLTRTELLPTQPALVGDVMVRAEARGATAARARAEAKASMAVVGGRTVKGKEEKKEGWRREEDRVGGERARSNENGKGGNQQQIRENSVQGPGIQCICPETVEEEDILMC